MSGQHHDSWSWIFIAHVYVCVYNVVSGRHERPAPWAAEEAYQRLQVDHRCREETTSKTTEGTRTSRETGQEEDRPVARTLMDHTHSIAGTLNHTHLIAQTLMNHTHMETESYPLASLDTESYWLGSSHAESYPHGLWVIPTQTLNHTHPVVVLWVIPTW